MAAPAKDFARFPAKSPSENGPTPSSSQNKDLAQVGGGECAGTDAISHVVEGKTADAEALPAQVGVLAEERRDFQAEGLQVDPARVGLHFAEVERSVRFDLYLQIFVCETTVCETFVCESKT